MAKKKTDPNPPDETELMQQPEETAADPPIEEALENMEGENDSTQPDFNGNEEEDPVTEPPSTGGEAGEGYDSLLQELGKQAMRQEDGVDEPLTLPSLDNGDASSGGYSPDDLLLLSEDNGNAPPSAAPDSSDSRIPDHAPEEQSNSDHRCKRRSTDRTGSRGHHLA